MTHTMSNPKMIEYAAQVKDCLVSADYAHTHDEIIEATRHCFINGWFPCECAAFIFAGEIPERFINIVEVQ